MTQFNFTPVMGKIDNLYIDQGQKLYLILTGTGLINASSKVARVLERFENIEKVFNLGVCGKLTSEELPPAFKIKLSNLREDFKISKNILPLGDVGFRCMSSSIPVFDKELAVKLSRHAEVVDMELYAVATVCAQFSIPLIAIKTVSDNADSDASTLDFKKEAPRWSKALFDFYNSEKFS